MQRQEMISIDLRNRSSANPVPNPSFLSATSSPCASGLMEITYDTGAKVIFRDR